MQRYVILLLKICVSSIYSFDFLSSALIQLCLPQVVLSTIGVTATLLVFMVITMLMTTSATLMMFTVMTIFMFTVMNMAMVFTIVVTTENSSFVMNKKQHANY